MEVLNWDQSTRRIGIIRVVFVESSCQSLYFLFALFALLMSLLIKYSHSHPPYSLRNLRSLAALICSVQRHHAHPLLTFCFPFTNSRIPQGQEANGCIKGRLGLQFTGSTNSMLATSLKSPCSRWSFPHRSHEQDQRPALEDLPRVFSPLPDPTPGWLPGPPHKRTMIRLQATCSARP